MFLSKLFKRKSTKLLTLFGALAMALGVGAATSYVASEQQNEVVETKADYSSTIRVYVVDWGWSNINTVRIGGNGAGNDAILSSSNGKYDSSKGKYVIDIASSATYDRMGFFFKEGSQQWRYRYYDGYIPIDGGWKPGKAYQISGVSWAEDGNPKLCNATGSLIGDIIDNIENASFYFVDGYSWHIERSCNVHYWGGSESVWPGPAMTDSGIRIKCYVGDTEYSGIHIYQYTISGWASMVKFSNNAGGQETGDLLLENGKVYYYGVDANDYENVASFLARLRSSMGTYSKWGRTYNPSICTISQDTAKTLVTSYEALASGTTKEQSSIAGSAIVTYTDPKQGTTTGEVLISDIYTELQLRASTGKWSAYLIPNSTGKEDSPLTTTLWIVLASGLAGLAAIGTAYFVSKKKRHQA